MGELTRRRVRIYGGVQGVGFRYSCQHEATRLGISGWVRNADDGTVEAVFEGDSGAVEAMSRWCQVGPRHAQVERVETGDEDPTGEPGFRVTG